MYFIMPVVIQLPFVAFMLKFQRRCFKIDHFKLLSLVSRTKVRYINLVLRGIIFFSTLDREICFQNIYREISTVVVPVPHLIFATSPPVFHMLKQTRPQAPSSSFLLGTKLLLLLLLFWWSCRYKRIVLSQEHVDKR